MIFPIVLTFDMSLLFENSRYAVGIRSARELLMVIWKNDGTICSIKTTLRLNNFKDEEMSTLYITY